jgi:hypothetical protein
MIIVIIGKKGFIEEECHLADMDDFRFYCNQST